MHFPRPLKQVFTLSLYLPLAVLVACGGGGGSSSGTVTLSGTAATGAPLAANSAISHVCSDGSSGNSALTQSNGSYTLDVPQSALPCALRVTTTTGDVLYSFTQGSSSPQTVNLTPVTTLIVEKAIRTNSSAASTNAWFAAPNAWLGIETSLPSTEAELGTALANAGHAVPTPFSPMDTSFTATTGNAYDDLLESIMGSSRETGKPLSTMAEDFTQGTPLPAPADNSTGIAATVNANLAGTYNLAFYDDGAGCDSKCGHTNGSAITAVVSSLDNTLTINGKTLSNPYFRLIGGQPHTPEIIWLDGAIEYALTNNDEGVFKEINVADTTVIQNGYPKFLGQIRQAGQTGPVLITGFAGTYALAQQYSGSTVAWNEVVIGTDGAITFNGGSGPNTTAAQIANVQDQNGCCSNAQVMVNYDLNGNGTVSADYDYIRLFKNGAGKLVALEYQASGTALKQRVGVRLGTLSDLPSHTGALTIPSNNALAATISGSAWQIALDSSLTDIGILQSNATAVNLVASSSSPNRTIAIQLDEKRLLQAGDTVDCAYKSNQTNEMWVIVNSNTYYSRDGGRCKITIDSISANGNNRITAISGRFVAELYDYRRNTPLTIDDGVFNWVKP